MFVGGQLVVKLPKARVDALVGAGEGARFDGNKGTPMKEWLVLASDSGAAMAAAGGRGARVRRRRRVLTPAAALW